MILTNDTDSRQLVYIFDSKKNDFINPIFGHF